MRMGLSVPDRGRCETRSATNIRMQSQTTTERSIHNSANRSAVPRLRVALLDDYPQLVSLGEKQGFAFRRFDEWRHFWSGNPALERLPERSSWPIGWVLETDEEIIGYIGNIPSLYELNGKKLIAATSHSWLIAPEYRSYATLLLDAYAHQNRAALLVVNIANQMSWEAMTAFGLANVPAGGWDRTGIWITRYRSFAKSWLRRKVSPVAAVLGGPGAAALWTKDAVLGHKLRPRRPAPTIEFCTAFDARFDTFWDCLTAEHPERLWATRSSQVLRWHYKFAAAEGRLWITLISAGSEMRAYAVFVLKRQGGDGLNRMMFADFQARAGDEALFVPLLDSALQRCRKEKVDLLETSGLSIAGTSVASLAPYQVRQPSWGLVYRALDTRLADRLRDASVWSPSFYDGGASL